MGGHKHIERCIGTYIAERYTKVAEVGIGRNFTAALVIRDAGCDIFATDITVADPSAGITVIADDIFEPCDDLYRDREAVYAIRPGIEMVRPLSDLARRINADLLVYHLGFECTGIPSTLIDCGVILHVYNRRAPETGGP